MTTRNNNVRFIPVDLALLGAGAVLAALLSIRTAGQRSDEVDTLTSELETARTERDQLVVTNDELVEEVGQAESGSRSWSRAGFPQSRLAATIRRRRAACLLLKPPPSVQLQNQWRRLVNCSLPMPEPRFRSSEDLVEVGGALLVPGPESWLELAREGTNGVISEQA